MSLMLENLSTTNFTTLQCCETGRADTTIWLLARDTFIGQDKQPNKSTYYIGSMTSIAK